MLAIAFLFALIVYLILSFLLAKWGAWLARQFGLRGWPFGMLAFIAMLGLVFWDWVPMEITYRFYCKNKAGLTQYKTIEEWREENSDKWKAIVPGERQSPSYGAASDYKLMLNSAFVQSVITTRKEFHVLEVNKSILNVGTQEVLARYIDYRTDVLPFGVGGKGLGQYKLWLQKSSCAKDGGAVEIKREEDLFWGISESIKYKK